MTWLAAIPSSSPTLQPEMPVSDSVSLSEGFNSAASPSPGVASAPRGFATVQPGLAVRGARPSHALPRCSAAHGRAAAGPDDENVLETPGVRSVSSSQEKERGLSSSALSPTRRCSTSGETATVASYSVSPQKGGLSPPAARASLGSPPGALANVCTDADFLASLRWSVSAALSVTFFECLLPCMASSAYPTGHGPPPHDDVKDADTWSGPFWRRRGLLGKSVSDGQFARALRALERQAGTKSFNSHSDSLRNSVRGYAPEEVVLRDVCPLSATPSSGSDGPLSRRRSLTPAPETSWALDPACLSEAPQCQPNGASRVSRSGICTTGAGPAGALHGTEEMTMCVGSTAALKHFKQSSAAVASGDSVHAGVASEAGPTVTLSGKRQPCDENNGEAGRFLRTQRTGGHGELTRAFMAAATRQHHGVRSRPSRPAVPRLGHTGSSAMEERAAPHAGARPVHRPGVVLASELDSAPQSLPVLVCTFGFHASFQQTCGGRQMADVVASRQTCASREATVQSNDIDQTTEMRESQPKVAAKPAVQEGGAEHQGLRLTLMRVGVAFLTFVAGELSLTRDRSGAAARSRPVLEPKPPGEPVLVGPRPLSESPVVALSGCGHSSTGHEVDSMARRAVSDLTGATQSKEGLDHYLSRDGDRFRNEADGPCRRISKRSHARRHDWLSAATKRTVVEGFTVRLGAQLLLVQPGSSEEFALTPCARKRPWGDCAPRGEHEEPSEVFVLGNAPDVSSSGGGRYPHSTTFSSGAALSNTSAQWMLSRGPEQSFKKTRSQALSNPHSSPWRTHSRANATRSSRSAGEGAPWIATAWQRQARTCVARTSEWWRQKQLPRQLGPSMVGTAVASSSDSDSNGEEFSCATRGSCSVDTVVTEDEDAPIPSERPPAGHHHHPIDQQGPTGGQARAGNVSAWQETTQRVALSVDLDIDPVLVS